MDDSAIICDEVIDVDADAEAKSNEEAKSNDETNFNKKNNVQNVKFMYFTCIFINYYHNIDSC